MRGLGPVISCRGLESGKAGVLLGSLSPPPGKHVKLHLTIIQFTKGKREEQTLRLTS